MEMTVEIMILVGIIMARMETTVPMGAIMALTETTVPMEEITVQMEAKGFPEIMEQMISAVFGISFDRESCICALISRSSFLSAGDVGEKCMEEEIKERIGVGEADGQG